MQKLPIKLFAWPFLLLIALSGYGQNAGPYFINLQNPIREEIPMSRLFSDIEIITLENRPQIGKFTRYYLSDSHIIAAHDLRAVEVFNRKTGQYEKKISKSGVREDEYLGIPISQYGFDEENDLFFFDNKRDWKGISLKSNKTVLRITKPKEQLILQSSESTQSTNTTKDNQKKGWKQGNIFNPVNLGNGKYAGFVNNTTGSVDVTFVIFDEMGNVLKSFPNPRKFVKNSISYPLNPGQFYKYNGQTYLKELFYCDTVFLLKDETLIPHIIFNLGDKKLPYESLAYDLDRTQDDKYRITFVQETNLYIFFNYSAAPQLNEEKILYSGYYEKSTGKTFVCQEKDTRAGFIDDVNGLCSFIPVYITQKEEIIGSLPIELLRQPDEQENLSQLGKSILEKVKTTNSQIIVIARIRR